MAKFVEYTTKYGDSELHVRFPDQSHLKIAVGDKVTISSSGAVVTGTVSSASNYGREGWFIELVAADVFGSVAYWKQYIDGGHITHINGKEVLPNA